MSTEKNIDYYFSIVSPWAYMGHARLLDLAKRFGVQVIYHPLSSPDLFPATGGQLLKDRAQHRKDYRLIELARWCKRLGISLNVQPQYFPIPEAPASKLVLAAQEAGHDVGPLLGAIFKAVWTDQLDASDAPTLKKLADGCGLDGAALLEASTDESYDSAFAQTTQSAIARGVFGYPSYVYNDELFWGQDRLEFVERTLSEATT